MSAPECWTEELGIYFDDLDLNGHLHNSRLVALVERAQTAMFERLGGAWTRPAERHEDLRYVVRELRVEFLAPVSAPGTLRVALRAQRIGTTSAVYGFRCQVAGSDVDAAIGHRAIIKVDLDGRPAPWTPWYREVFTSLAAGVMPAASA
jgi:acyl-CoA thioester hydrolase